MDAWRDYKADGYGFKSHWSHKFLELFSKFLLKLKFFGKFISFVRLVLVRFRLGLDF